MPDLKHKVVKLPSGETIAFPATMPDAQVAGLITAFRQGKFNNPESGQTHTGNLHTQVSPKTMENSEHLRQSGDTTPQLPAPSWNELRQYVNDKTQPTILPPLQGKLNYSQSAQDINARANNFTQNSMKRAARFLFGVVDMVPQTASIIQRLYSSDPAVSSQAEGDLLSMHPGAQIGDRAKEVIEDWKKSPALAGSNLTGDALGFYLVGRMGPHDVSAVPLDKEPPRFRTRRVYSGPMGDVRVGTDNIPTVWMHPKAWESLMDVLYPGEDAGNTHGMSLGADENLLKRARDKGVSQRPEFKEVQTMLEKAHAAAQGSSDSVAVGVKRGRGIQHAVRLMREERNHAYQRSLSQNKRIMTHLSPEGFTEVAKSIPGTMSAHLQFEGYDPQSAPEMVSEAAARMIGGELRGATPEQAGEFLDKYFQQAVKEHGPKALETLEHVRGEGAKAKERINAEHNASEQGATRTGVPEVATGRQGGAGAAPQGGAGQAGTTAPEVALNRRGKPRERAQEGLAVPYKIESAVKTDKPSPYGGRHYDGSPNAEIWTVKTDAGDVDVFVHPGGGEAEAEQQAAMILGQNIARGVPAERLFNPGTYKPTEAINAAEINFRDAYQQLRKEVEARKPDTALARSKTNTPAFKEWFGESKAKDEKGEPLVLYHGTTRLKPRRLRTSFESGIGIFLTNNQDVADTFTYPREYGEPVYEDEDGKEIKPGSTVPVYARIENPLVLTGDEAQTVSDDTAVQSRTLRSAKEAGHDGVILRGVKEGIGQRSVGDTYIVFDPKQVKGVKNSGAFSRDTADLALNRQRPSDDEFDNKYPTVTAGSKIDGRVVRREVPNQSSIDASSNDPTVLRGIREVPMSEFPAPPDVNPRTKALAEDIKNSGEINPLIVMVDKDGPYILEGGHRYDALKILGAKSFPAVVVVDEDDFGDSALNRERPESGEAYEKLSRLRINSDLGQENTAALVTPKGKVLVGDWHTELYKESGYGDKGGEAKFFKEGGVRIRAQNNESHIEFSQIDPATVERVTNAIHALPGREVTLEYMPLGLGKGTLFSLGDKTRALSDLSMWARRGDRSAPQYGSAAYWHQQGDTAFNRQYDFDDLKSIPYGAGYNARVADVIAQKIPGSTVTHAVTTNSIYIHLPEGFKEREIRISDHTKYGSTFPTHIRPTTKKGLPALVDRAVRAALVGARRYSDVPTWEKIAQSNPDTAMNRAPVADLREDVPDGNQGVPSTGSTKTVWGIASLGALKNQVLQNSPHKVEAPDGKTYVFQDIEGLNNFRNEAGIDK